MQKADYELVIFDLDGTLADTSFGILNCIRYTQQKMHLPEITLEQMYSYVGPPAEESYHRHFGLTGERLKQAVAFHKEYAVRQGYRELQLYAGMRELVEALKSAGCKTAVATLKAHATAVKIFEHLHMTELFDLVMGTEIDHPLTKAQLLQRCTETLGIEKRRAVLVGDSMYDADGARQAGIDFIGVLYGFGFQSRADVEVYPHVCVCENAAQLAEYFSGCALPDR